MSSEITHHEKCPATKAHMLFLKIGESPCQCPLIREVVLWATADLMVETDPKVFLKCPVEECGEEIPVSVRVSLRTDEVGNQSMVTEPDLADIWAHSWAHGVAHECTTG